MSALASASDVIFPRGNDRLRGYLALPEGSGSQPALLLIPDVRGLYEHYRDVARRFAAEGYVTLAADLYSREGTPDLPDMDAVFRWMACLDDRRVLADLQAARDFLAARAEVDGTRIGVTGFCMGGQYAFMAACQLDGLAACVAWYGMLRYAETNDLKPESPLDMATRIGCPYLGMFGADDPIIRKSDVDELRTRLSSARHSVKIETFAEAGHAFFNDSRPDMYREAAAAASWEHALAFLHRHLGSDGE